MSIKNNHIIHLLDRDNRYACIKACGITKEKCTKDIKKVTCKNCKRIIWIDPHANGLQTET